MKLPSKPVVLNLCRLACACTGGALVVAASLYLYLSPKLPTVETLKEVKLQTPLRIYSQDSKLIGEYGEKRRNPVKYREIPTNFISAILAAEDDRFYRHRGVDFKGLMRAGVQLIKSGEIQSGGSTITMQVARNFFLSSEQTFVRKFNEILLSLRIEDELTKDEILTLYANKIYLGNRAYGIDAASQVYYGLKINELNLAQLAMIAGLPKAPSRYNPIANPERALIRRNWILGRMKELGYIDDTTYRNAVEQPVTASYHGYQAGLNAPYVAEMARQIGLDMASDDLYTAGYRIYTTIDSGLQQAARKAVRDGLMTYDKRHGYHGPERRLKNPLEWQEILENTPNYGGLEPALVTVVGEQELTLQLKNGETATLGWQDGLEGLRLLITENRRSAPIKTASDVFRAGDLIRVMAKQNEDGSSGWNLSQIPQAQAAIVALDPENGAIRSLVGGFDYYHSKFNRITQAQRQPGSNFKPFIYTAALESGLTAATTISGAPITIRDAALESYWRPENDAGRVFGPTRLRQGLYRSLNTVSIRLLRTIGIDRAIDSATRFGFDKDTLPRNATLILGSAAVPPIKIATGYAAFANGGYQVSPYLVDRIEDVNGNVIYQATPATVCRDCDKPAIAVISDDAELEIAVDDLATELGIDEETLADEPGAAAQEVMPELPRAPRIIDPQTAYIMDSILKDVIKKGTGRKARVLNRNDIAGKTGTNNDARDAWFSGYSPHLVATAWVGFDDYSPLGRREYGGTAALPIWIDFMRDALNGESEIHHPQPDGLVMVRIDPDTGERVGPESANAIFELFRQDFLPPSPGGQGAKQTETAVPDDLF